MSRPLRIQYPNAHYHICARGNERRRLFWEEKDYEQFCLLLEDSCKRFDLRLFAFVLMTNHFHLMVETPLGNLSAAMHWLKTSYSVWINRKRGRVGHLFQGRYYSVIIENESHYLELSRYIHLNPVRAGIVKRPEDYEWSSCRDYVNKEKCHVWIERDPVLNEIGGTDKMRHIRYRGFLYEGMKLKDEAFAAFRRGWILGSDTFKGWLAEKFEPDDNGEIVGMNELRVDRLSCEEAKKALHKELKNILPERANHRGTLMYALYRIGYTQKEIGAIFGVSYSAVAQNAKRYRAEKKEVKLLEQAMSNVKR